MTGRNAVIIPALSVLLLPAFLAAGIRFELTDIGIYSEIKNKLSSNTNLQNKNYESFQEVKFNLKAYLLEGLSAWVNFKSFYSQLHGNRFSRFMYADAAALEYETTPASKLMLGYIYVNYSPYIAMSFPWVRNIFRGIAFEYNSCQWYGHVFAANNSENPKEADWDTPVTFDLDYRFVKDPAYVKNNTLQDVPSIWAGSKLRYSFTRNETFTPDIALIYFRENYVKRDRAAGYNDVNANNILGTELNFNLLDYLVMKNTGAVTFNRADKYEIKTNYLGTGGDAVTNTRSVSSRYTGGKIRLEFPDLLVRAFGHYNTRGFAEYEKVDPDFHPTYMNQNLDNRSINPYDNVYSGREGFWAGIEQNLGSGFYLGAGYQRYLYRTSYYHHFPGGAVFTEKQIMLKNDLNKQLRLFFIFQAQKMLKGTLPDGEREMNSFYVRLQSDIVDSIYLELEYCRNKNYKKNYDEMLIKFFVWGW